MSSDLLRLLVCRSLCVAGQEHLAAHLLTEPDEGNADWAHLLPALKASACPPALWKLCAAGYVRPISWISQPGGNSWVVDLRRLGEPGVECLDLALFPGLRLMLENMAILWDRSGGQGILAIAAPGRRRLQPSGRLARANRPQRGRPEIMDYCREVIARMQTDRGWPGAPVVIGLALPASRLVHRRRG